MVTRVKEIIEQPAIGQMGYRAVDTRENGMTPTKSRGLKLISSGATLRRDVASRAAYTYLCELHLKNLFRDILKII